MDPLLLTLGGVRQLVSSSVFTGVALCVIAAIIHRMQSKKTAECKRLPSPPAEPLLGHARMIPVEYAWLLFAEWYKKYGEIIIVKVFGNSTVILNTVASARELLERKGANFSGRPPMYIFSEWMGLKSTLAFKRRSDREHRLQRRFLRQQLSMQSIATHYPTMYLHASKLLDNLRLSPEDFMHHAHFYIACIIIMVTYGYECVSPTDPLLLMNEDLLGRIAAVQTTTLMVIDAIPLAKLLPEWLPGMAFKKSATGGNTLRQKLTKSCYDYVRESKAAGKSNTSVVSRIIDQLHADDEILVGELHSDKENLVKNIGIVTYLAGVETAYTTLLTFFLAMAMYPHVVRQAQDEIDAATGGPTGRLPTFDDRPNLPYLDCILREVLRWNPPLPLGVPHMSERPDDYHGLAVPANCTVIPNLWFMCHDEDHFISPDTFNPGRFRALVERNNNSPVGLRADDPKAIVFGFGRRICPGAHIADAVIWNAMASILAKFDILAPLDEKTGEVIIPKASFTSGTTSRPDTFKCRIVPRERHGQRTD